MRTLLFLTALATSIAHCAIGAADPTLSETVVRVAIAERRLPWFWSPIAEGITDIPYTYELLMPRRVIRGGREIDHGTGSSLREWRTLRLERIPLEFGAFMRCLALDGASPCSDEWNQELDRQARKRDSFTAEERIRIEATREQRRERRRNFWDDFPEAMRFEAAGTHQLAFSPRPGYKPRRDVHNGMLTAIRGTLSFDPATGEIQSMRYDLLRDVDEPFLRYLKGAHFEIALAQTEDGHYVPQRIFERYQVPKTQRFEERTTEYSKFRRFDAESKIDFGDAKEEQKK
jgi:hypothetical protein